MAQARDQSEVLLERARKFIERCQKELNWEDLSGDTVMDIGCGAQFLCTRALLEKFPQIRYVIAIDKFPIMTEEIMDEFFAQYFRNGIIQFNLADIVDRYSLEGYRNVVNKIVCRSTLQQITNKELAFQNMYNLLRPGGHAAIMFSIVNPLDSWWLRIGASTYWAQYRRDLIPLFTPANLEDGYYKNVLEDIGFRVIRCERSDMQLQFLNDQSFTREWLTCATALLGIPVDKIPQFYEESINLFKELIGYGGSGPLTYEASELLLLAIKP